MSVNETTSLSPKAPNVQGMVFHRSALPEGDEVGQFGALATSQATPTLVVSSFLHAFRRVWLAALLLGVIVAGVAAIATWFTQTPSFTAISVLRIAPNEQQLTFWTANRFNAESYENYRGTQLELVKSRFVLTAALAIRKSPVCRSWRTSPIR